MRTCELSTSYAESVKRQENDDQSVAALLDLSNEVVEGLDKFWYDEDDEE